MQAPTLANSSASNGRVNLLYTNGSVPVDEAANIGVLLRCFTCPTRALCPSGGAVMVPQPGAWHSGAGSTAMLSCMNPASCRQGNTTAQDLLVQCQTAWWSTVPPGLAPHRLPDGRLCIVEGAVTMPAYSAKALTQRGSLVQAQDVNMTIWNNSNWVNYTDLQCVRRSMGPLCGACEPGTYSTSKRECLPCGKKPGDHAGIGVIMLFLNMLLVLVIGTWYQGSCCA